MAAFRKTQIPCNRDETIGSFFSQVMGGCGISFSERWPGVCEHLLELGYRLALPVPLRYMCVRQWFSTALSVNISRPLHGSQTTIFSFLLVYH